MSVLGSITVLQWPSEQHTFCAHNGPAFHTVSLSFKMTLVFFSWACAKPIALKQFINTKETYWQSPLVNIRDSRSFTTIFKPPILFITVLMSNFYFTVFIYKAAYSVLISNGPIPIAYSPFYLGQATFLISLEIITQVWHSPYFSRGLLKMSSCPMKGNGSGESSWWARGVVYQSNKGNFKMWYCINFFHCDKIPDINSLMGRISLGSPFQRF